MTLKDKRSLQKSLEASMEEQQARLKLLESHKQQLQAELHQVNTCLSLDLDHKAQQMQHQLEVSRYVPCLAIVIP